MNHWPLIVRLGGKDHPTMAPTAETLALLDRAARLGLQLAHLPRRILIGRPGGRVRFCAIAHEAELYLQALERAGGASK